MNAVLDRDRTNRRKQATELGFSKETGTRPEAAPPYSFAGPGAIQVEDAEDQPSAWANDPRRFVDDGTDIFSELQHSHT
jgi:hypothetical protein